MSLTKLSISTILLVSFLVYGCSGKQSSTLSSSESLLDEELIRARSYDLEIGKVVEKEIKYGKYYQYIPTTVFAASKIVVIVHGTPGANETALEVARTFIARWISLAEEEEVILIAPAFAKSNFGSRRGPGGGYRGLFGREISADRFVNLIVDSYQTPFTGIERRMYLYGHSAGGQFVSRYALMHPDRLVAAVISAAGTFAFPNPHVKWTNGMARLRRTMRWSASEQVQVIDIQPKPQAWLKIATSSISVVVGENDTKPFAHRIEGQKGNNRVERAQAWVADMNAWAGKNDQIGTVKLKIISGVGHNSLRLTPACQASLFQ